MCMYVDEGHGEKVVLQRPGLLLLLTTCINFLSYDFIFA